MQVKKVTFSRQATTFYFDASFSHLKKLVSPKTTVVITDEHVFAAHQKKLKDWNTIVLKPGEEYKVQATVDSVMEQLIDMI